MRSERDFFDVFEIVPGNVIYEFYDSEWDLFVFCRFTKAFAAPKVSAGIEHDHIRFDPSSGATGALGDVWHDT